MSHAWVGIPDLIQEEFEDNLVEEARKVAVLEAQDLAIATAVRDACLEIQENLTENERLHRVAPSRHMGYRAENGAELIRDLDLNEIIKGVK